ncbi:hypothetical protein EVA_20962 [gut metagenome]|uniref:Uncharacterized protein n=1 Tax=gut metagenome TaxID=749906 RepID=J9FU82_9ZZZZ
MPQSKRRHFAHHSNDIETVGLIQMMISHKGPCRPNQIFFFLPIHGSDSILEVLVATGFHLYEYHFAKPFRHNIDFQRMHPPISCQQCIPLVHQITASRFFSQCTQYQM